MIGGTVSRGVTSMPGKGARVRHHVVPALLLSAAILMLPPPESRARQTIPFDHLSVKNGLSQGSVICILQDAQGFMWFGTQDGLNRFDGYEFKVFRHDPADSTTLNDNFVITIAEDSSRTLWVATLNNPEHLNRYDRVTGTFTQVHRDSVDLFRARVSSAYTAYQDPSGVRWKGSIGGGLTRLDPRTGQERVYRHSAEDPASLSDDRVHTVYGDRSGTIWVGTREGLDRYDPRTDSFVHFRHNPKDPSSISDNWVWPILEDRAGNLWVGTFRGGLNRFDRSTGTFVRYTHDESNPRSLADDRLYALYQDRSGMIWVGTGDHGVDRFHPELAVFGHYRKDPKNPDGLIDDNIMSIAVDSKGFTWIGTRGGLDRWDRRNGRFTHFLQDPANPATIADNTVQCLLEDRNGTLWLGTNNGLDRYDRRSGTFAHYKRDPSRPGTLSDNRVYALAEDRSGSIWVGTYGGGLNLLDTGSGRFTTYQHDDSIAASLAAQGVWSLLLDRDGVLWVGTYGGGLDRLDSRTGSFTHFRHQAADTASISDDVIICLLEDRAGYLWAGTLGGLNRMDRANGTFRSYRTKDGLSSDVVLGLLEDNRGHLWVSTTKGLSRFDPQTDQFRTFDYSDGLQGDEFNQGAYAKDPRTGELYFGGGNGFNLFNPDDVRDNPYIPPVVFSSFYRYNTDDEEGRPIEEKGIDARSSVTLSYKDNVATLEFAALNYHNTFKNQYAYRLEGYSDQWIQLGPERRATFTNLDGGEYTLTVRGSNNDGVWNNDGASLLLTVTPPWWKTRWAYVSYAFLTVGFLYSVRRLEINRREQKARLRESELQAKAAVAEKRALEAEHARKTKELEDARNLQVSLLPSDIPRLPDHEIAVFMKTATEVGGDYYDFLAGENGEFTVACGDATGHGMQAGTIVTLMKGLFVSDASRFDIVSFFNHCSKAIKGIKLGRLFMAFTLVRLRGNSISWSSAGMPPTFVYRKDGGTVEEVMITGLPLGAMKKFAYSVHETELRDGDTVLLLTDGLPEQKNASQEMFDYSRVQKVFAESGALSPQEIIAQLMKAGEEWMTGAVQEDDITLLVIRKKEHAAA